MLLAALLLALSAIATTPPGPALSVRIPTTHGCGNDTVLTTRGGIETAALRVSAASPAAEPSVVLLRFDLRGLADQDLIASQLNLQSLQPPRRAIQLTLYGLPGADAESWPAITDPANPAATGSCRQLATFLLDPRSGLRHRVSSPALTDFIRQNPNRVVTLLLAAGPSETASVAFASRRHPQLHSPTLILAVVPQPLEQRVHQLLSTPIAIEGQTAALNWHVSHLQVLARHSRAEALAYAQALRTAAQPPQTTEPDHAAILTSLLNLLNVESARATGQVSDADWIAAYKSELATPDASSDLLLAAAIALFAPGWSDADEKHLLEAGLPAPALGVLVGWRHINRMPPPDANLRTHVDHVLALAPYADLCQPNPALLTNLIRVLERCAGFSTAMAALDESWRSAPRSSLGVAAAILRLQREPDARARRDLLLNICQSAPDTPLARILRPAQLAALLSDDRLGAALDLLNQQPPAADSDPGQADSDVAALAASIDEHYPDDLAPLALSATLARHLLETGAHAQATTVALAALAHASTSQDVWPSIPPSGPPDPASPPTPQAAARARLAIARCYYELDDFDASAEILAAVDPAHLAPPLAADHAMLSALVALQRGHLETAHTLAASALTSFPDSSAMQTLAQTVSTAVQPVPPHCAGSETPRPAAQAVIDAKRTRAANSDRPGPAVALDGQPTAAASGDFSPSAGAPATEVLRTICQAGIGESPARAPDDPLTAGDAAYMLQNYQNTSPAALTAAFDRLVASRSAAASNLALRLLLRRLLLAESAQRARLWEDGLTALRSAADNIPLYEDTFSDIQVLIDLPDADRSLGAMRVLDDLLCLTPSLPSVRRLATLRTRALQNSADAPSAAALEVLLSVTAEPTTMIEALTGYLDAAAQYPGPAIKPLATSTPVRPPTAPPSPPGPAQNLSVAARNLLADPASLSSHRRILLLVFAAQSPQSPGATTLPVDVPASDPPSEELAILAAAAAADLSASHQPLLRALEAASSCATRADRQRQLAASLPRQLVWARFLNDTGRHDSAVTLWADALDRASLLPDAMEWPQRILAAIPQDAPARAAELAAQLAARSPRPCHRRQLWLLQASHAYAAGDPRAALTALGPLATDPAATDGDKLALQITRAMSLLKLNRPDDALAALDTRLDPGRSCLPDDAQRLFLCAWIHIRRNDTAAAAPYLLRIVDEFPHSSLAARSRDLLRRAGRVP